MARALCPQTQGAQGPSVSPVGPAPLVPFRRTRQGVPAVVRLRYFISIIAFVSVRWPARIR